MPRKSTTTRAASGALLVSALILLGVTHTPRHDAAALDSQPASVTTPQPRPAAVTTPAVQHHTTTTIRPSASLRMAQRMANERRHDQIALWATAMERNHKIAVFAAAVEHHRQVEHLREVIAANAAAARARAARTAQESWHPATTSAPTTGMSSSLSGVAQCIKNHESGNYTESSHPASGSGAYQWIPSSWQAWSARAGYPGYTYAYQAPPSVQDAVTVYALTHGGAGNWSTRYGADPCTAGMPGGG